MIKLWSELPAARSAEIGADVATGAWVAFWSWVAWSVYTFMASFAEAGRAVQQGGRNLTTTGEELGRALGDVPLVGDGLRNLTADLLRNAGQPFISFGSELESLILFMAALLSLIVLAIPLVPWLARYLPWRTERLARVRAAHRVIRRAPSDLPEPVLERLLASRALHRLPFETLLDYTPDPFGDFASGRHDRLARAELASVGLRGVR
jgi:hypothetical protein